MTRRPLLATGVLAGAAALVAAAGGQVVANRRRGHLDRRRVQLTGRGGTVDRGALPAPVQRWLDLALVDVPAHPGLVRLEQRFTMAGDDGRWRAGTAVHLASTARPGFCWWATLPLGPLLAVHVEDALVGGAGLLDARVAGLVPVAHEEGEATTRGELLRYLAELAWAPVAVAADPDLRWTAIDEGTAEVTAAVGTVEGAVRLSFDPGTGLPTVAEAPSRPRREGDRLVDRPWRGTFAGEVVLGGMRLPPRGEVAWRVDGAWSPYWRGEVTAAAVLPAPA